nr:putative ORF3 [Fig virus A]
MMAEHFEDKMSKDNLTRFMYSCEEDFDEDLEIDFLSDSLPDDSSLKLTLMDSYNIKNSVCILAYRYDSNTILVALFDDKNQEFKKDHTTSLIKGTHVKLALKRERDCVQVFLSSKMIAIVSAGKVKLMLSTWSTADCEIDFTKCVLLSRRLKEVGGELDTEKFPKTPNNEYVRREYTKRNEIKKLSLKMYFTFASLSVIMVLLVVVTVLSVAAG